MIKLDMSKVKVGNKTQEGQISLDLDKVKISTRSSNSKTNILPANIASTTFTDPTKFFRAQQQYKQNNPNLYSVMGGRAYNPIPSVNPTQLTKEELEKVQTAQAADAKYHDPILRQELKDKMDAAKSMYDDFYKGENDLQTFLNKIGGVGGGEEAREKYKKKYEDAAADYYSLTVGNEEMRKQRISELEREVGILQIKMRENPQSKKSLETQLDEVRAELNGLRTSLYGKATIGEYVGAHALAGADSVSTGVYNTLGLIIGKPLEWIGWKDNPVLKLKEFTQKNHERLQNEALLASKTMGDDYNVGGMLIQGVVAAIPDAALAFATAGTSKAVQLGTKAPGFFAALSRTATNMAKNPMFWSSYVRTLGNDYDSAIEDGASPEAAFIYAQLTSTLNAAVEIGGETGHGGIQTLPDALKNAGKNKSAILEWVTSSLDEGKEEVIQSVISDLNARIIYNSDKKPDIVELAKEGAMGIAVGVILGGGQISANMILNADTRAEYKQIGEVALRQEDFEGIISYARKSVDTDIRALALSSTPQNISAENAGLLYSYVYKDITAAIASPAESATARQNFIDIMRENDSATVQALAGSRYIIRMSEDPQIGEMPTIDNINTESVIDNEENSELQSTANNESAITPNEEATVENLADQAQEVDKVSSEENKPTVFTEPKTRELATDKTAEEKLRVLMGEQITTRQRQINRSAEKFGIKVIWSDTVSRGKYNPQTNTITLNPDIKLYKAYGAIFGHEFVHFLENRKGYDSFKKYLFKNSMFFEEYIRGRYKEDTGAEFKGNRKELLNAYANIVYKLYTTSGEVSKAVSDAFTMEKAEREMVADFVGDVMLGSETYEETEALLQEIANTDRTLLQRIKDFIAELIAKLKGYSNNNTLVKDLEYLQKRIAQVYDSVEIKNTAFKKEKSVKTKSTSETESYSLRPDSRMFITPELAKYAEQVFIKYDSMMLNDGTPVNKSIERERNIFLQAIKNYMREKNINPYKEEIYPSADDKKFVEAMDRVVDSWERNYDATNPVHRVLDEISLKPQEAPETVPDFKSEVAKENQTLEKAKKLKSARVEPKKYARKILRNNRSRQDTEILSLQIEQINAAIDTSDYSEGMRIALVAAKEVVEGSAYVQTPTSDALDILEEIKTSAIKLDTAQRKEVAFSYGSYGDFFRRNMGKLKIRNEGISLDTKWQEWAEQYPNVFDKDTNAVDMPIALANIVDSLKSQFVDYDIEGATESLASQIFTECVLGSQEKFTENIREAIKKVQAAHQKELYYYSSKLSQKEKQIKRQNEQLAKRRSEIVREETERRNERADKQKNIEYIRREVARIERLMRTNSDTKHIPENLKGVISNFIGIFLDNDYSPFEQKDIHIIREAFMEYSEIGENIDEATEQLIEAYDVDVKERLKELSKTLEGKTLKKMSLVELLYVRDIVDNFKFILKNENEMFVENRKRDVAEVGSNALQDLEGEKNKRENDIIRGIDKIKFANLTPPYFFKMLGDTFTKLYDDVVEGQNKWFKNMEVSKTYIQATKEKYNYSKWKDKKVKLGTMDGNEFDISIEQALLLYATAKREKINTQQQAEHLFKGGVVLDESLNQKKFKDMIKTYKKLKKEGIEKSNKLVESFTDEVNSKSHRISPINVGDMNLQLTEEQKAYADAMVEYLSNDMASLGNEVSIKLFGIAKYNEKYYIPYNSAQNYLYSQPGVTNEQRLKHQGFTKATIHKANNPLVLSSFSDVCADHINRMCMYNALTLPLENINRIYNYQELNGDGEKTGKTVKTQIEQKFGAQANSYLNDFLTSMNGNVRSSDTESNVKYWISKFKKGAVFLSASVVVQQPSAIMRAMALVNPKYFVSTSFKTAERDYQQLIKYAPVAGIKEMGRFDTSLGVSNTEWLLRETPKTKKEKISALFSTEDSSYRDDVLSFFAAKADEMTWAHIWAAVKAETVDKTNLPVGSEEFLEYAGKRFTEVINYTQVYDSTLVRSKIMRDKSGTATMLTAFMSEPTVNLNLFIDAMRDASKKNEKKAVASISALIATVIVNSLLKSLVTAARDDDEEKTYLEKYIGKFSESVLSDMFVPNLIPVVKDVVSLFQGYTAERADMALFSDFVQSISVLLNDNKTIGEKIESISSSIAAFFGLPVKNVIRDIKAVVNVYSDFFVKKNSTDSIGVKYAMLDALGFDSAKADKYADLADAAERGDEKEYQKIYAHLIDAGEEDGDIRAGLKKAYGEESKDEVEKILKDIEKNKTFKKFDEDSKKDFEKKAKTILANERTEKALGNIEKYDKLYEYYRKNRSQYNEYRKKLKADGLTDSQINEGMELARISYLKKNGVDLREYLLYKIATNKNNADFDNSGGVSTAEKNQALKVLDVSSADKKQINNLK